jgi:hypothetical protein
MMSARKNSVHLIVLCTSVETLVYTTIADSTSAAELSAAAAGAWSNSSMHTLLNIRLIIANHRSWHTAAGADTSLFI